MDENNSQQLTTEFLRVSRHELKKALGRIEHCVAKLSAEQVWSREHEIENSIGNLILHVAGNIRQWIISGVGGAPDRRNRDAEFAQRSPIAPDELLTRLRETLNEAGEVLSRLEPADLLSTRRIQVYDVTVLNAVYHVVEHFGEHTGQILWATKRLTGEDLGFYSYLEKNRQGEKEQGRLP